MTRLKELHERLNALPTVSVCQIDSDSNSVGVTFEYNGETFTTYIDAATGRGELLRHDEKNITITENMGTVTESDLIDFFLSLPSITNILK